MSAELLSTKDAFALNGIPGCDQGGLKQDFHNLNSDQKQAVLKVFPQRDFTLIQGLHGG